MAGTETKTKPVAPPRSSPVPQAPVGSKKGDGDAKAQLDAALDRLKRAQADFDNYRKMVERTNLQSVQSSNEALIRKLLIVLDGFDAAVVSIKSEADRTGMVLLRQTFLEILSSEGLKSIGALGKKFDPYYHEALLMRDSDGPDGVVLEEIQKGYLLNGVVIRHTRVVVSKKSGDKK
jgi:molecular chaperone GrpE